MSSPLPLPPPQPPSNDAPVACTTKSLRPWREFFDTNTLSLPNTFSKTITRLKKNSSYFKVNYVFIALMIIPILTLLHNLTITTLLVSAALLAAYYYYFSARCTDIPIQVFGFTVHDVTVGRALFIATMLCMILPYPYRFNQVFVLEYMVVVWLHAGLRDARTDNGDVDDPSCGLLGNGAGGANYNTMQQP